MNTTVNTWTRVFPVARSYMWDAKFADFPGIFPASILNVEITQFENDKVNYGPWGFDFPKMAQSGNVDIVVYELNSFPVFTWMRKWLTDYVNAKSWGVGLIGEQGVARNVTVFMNNMSGAPVVTHEIKVIPSGAMSYALNSEKNGQISPSMTFTIVGD